MSVNVIQWPWTNTINIQDNINPVNNYMWVATTPNPSYVTRTGYYIQTILTGSNLNFTNNTYVYNNVYNQNAVWDMHKVLQGYVSYDTQLFNTLQKSNIYATTNTLYNYEFNVREMSGSQVLAQTGFAQGGCVINAAIDRNTQWNAQPYCMYLPGNQSKFLTDWTGSVQVRAYDKANVQWFYNPSTTGVNVNTGVLMLYDADNNLLYSGSVQNPYASTLGTYVLAMGVGPMEIQNSIWYNNIYGTGGTTSRIFNSYPNTAYYTISLYSPQVGLMATQRFNIDLGCTLIDNIELIWLNKLGGWSNYSFYREYHNYRDVNRTTYTKNDTTFNGTTMGTTQYSRGETVLTVDETLKYVLKSKVVNDLMSKNISGIADSPEVYIYINNVFAHSTSDQAYLGTIIPVIIDDTEVEIMKTRNTTTNPQGRSQYTITCHKSNKEININQ
jgi:hypothetical protein